MIIVMIYTGLLTALVVSQIILCCRDLKKQNNGNYKPH
jgi:hypothetical protein